MNVVLVPRLRSYEQAIMAEIDRNMVEQMQGAYMGGRGDDRYAGLYRCLNG